MTPLIPETTRSAGVHRAGKPLLSLALIDARNRSLRWAAALEGSQAAAAELARRLGGLGWFQEQAIARNVDRRRGADADPARPRLASILPHADAWFADRPPGTTPDPALPPPDLQTIRQYLVDTLETTLDLLEPAPETDAGLYFHRLALFREDRAAEDFAVLAQSLGLETDLAPLPPLRPLRDPLLFPSTRQRIGAEPGGFAPACERWAHEVVLPEFEIDAQAVSWAQYGEFVADGGYDDASHWSAAGWAWVQAEGRRTPRHVDQMRQGVLQRSFGRLVRVPGGRPVLHLAWFEADAWCRWAGRRLPSEVEWECAAVQGASRGFRWGEVREWTAGTLRPYPNADRPAAQACAVDPAAPHPRRVLRGVSFASPERLRGACCREGEPADHDAGFVGFRSCAV